MGKSKLDYFIVSSNLIKKWKYFWYQNKKKYSKQIKTMIKVR